MLNPQIILIALVAMLASTGLGFYSGQNWANTRHEAQRASDLDAYNRQLNLQMSVAHDLSDRLAKAEGKITTKTIEVIKYVDRYTTGTTPCLNGAAVGVLQPGSNTGLRTPTGQPAAEDATPVASDRDIFVWIAIANQHYETCSARLTALVDFELTTNPEPLRSDGL